MFGLFGNIQILKTIFPAIPAFNVRFLASRLMGVTGSQWYVVWALTAFHAINLQYVSVEKYPFSIL